MRIRAARGGWDDRSHVRARAGARDRELIDDQRERTLARWSPISSLDR
jgi:hypothetical protein